MGYRIRHVQTRSRSTSTVADTKVPADAVRHLSADGLRRFAHDASGLPAAAARQQNGGERNW